MPDKPWNGRKIVIIDDSKAVRDALKSVYTSLGIHVVGLAENGMVGLQKIQELRPDIVNLDLIMPEMDGVECYRRIQAIDPQIKCLINSWLSGELKVISGLSELMPEYIFQSKTTSGPLLEARLDILFNPQKATARSRTQTEPANGEDFSDLGIKVS